MEANEHDDDGLKNLSLIEATRLDSDQGRSGDPSALHRSWALILSGSQIHFPKTSAGTRPIAGAFLRWVALVERPARRNSMIVSTDDSVDEGGAVSSGNMSEVRRKSIGLSP